MQIKRLVFITLLVALYSGMAVADVVPSKGKGSATYTEQQASPDVKAKALQAAQMNAIDFYYAELGDSEAENLDTIRDTIRRDPDRFILDTTVLSDQDDTAGHKYSVAVRVSLNGSNLRAALKASSAVGSTPKEHKSQLAFIFLSRQVDTETTFDPRVTQRQTTDDQGGGTSSVQREGHEGEAIRKSQVSTDSSTKEINAHNNQQSITLEKGGATLARSNAKTWKLIPSEDLSTAVALVFKTAGYRVVEAQYVEPLTGGKLKVASIEDDYRSGNDLKSGTLIGVVDGLRTAEVRYFALATLDVGQVGVDPSTGLKRVVVTVNAKVTDVGQRIAENVAVAGPTQYAGSGPTEEEARTNALMLAAQRSARELTSQLANEDLR